MKREDLKKILETTEFSKAEILGRGFEATALSKVEWDFVVKIGTGPYQDRVRASHETALEHLGGLAVSTSIVEGIPLTFEGTTYDVLYVQEKLVPIMPYINFLQSQNRLNMIEDLIIKITESMKLQLGRGCYKSDCNMGNNGLNSSNDPLLIDLGFVLNDYTEVFPEMRDIYCGANDEYGKTQRFNQRGFIHYNNRNRIAEIHPPLGDVYEQGINLDFDPDVDIENISRDDIEKYCDYTINIMRCMGLADFPPKFSNDSVSALLSIWEGKPSPQRFSLYHAIIRNKYADQFNAISKQEVKLYHNDVPEKVKVTPFVL